ncbi:Neuropeptide Y receptor [Fasciola hepatica]|uniref:Neuropeptide Y receptor n=1 Tax=Fasciola hepatica TaxID=6192 RepID=A0A4E0RYH8_FASHE|nr:Neuropeptide Y receptor [Fasciola hepatica]
MNENVSGTLECATEYAQAFTTWEVALLTTLNLTLVVTAVVGNFIVCVLLRFRYMRVFRYIKHWCSNRDGQQAIQVYRESSPHELWADEYPSSQHECSCGKPYSPAQPAVMGNRYVVFKAGRKLPIAYTGRKDEANVLNPTVTHRHSSQKHHTRIRLFRRHPRMGPKSSSITSMFLFNLSVADFLMALLIIPIHVTVEIIYLSWPLGYTMCKLSSYLQGISVFVSALTHVVISWDRVVLIYFPLRPRMTQRNAVTLIIAVWILACIIPFPMLVVNQLQEENYSTQCMEDWTVLFPNLVVNRTTIPPQFLFELEFWEGANIIVDISFAYTVLLMILQYFLPLGVICGTYAAIAIRIKSLQTPGERDQVRDLKLSRARHKMVKMLTTVAILYGLSQLPRHIVYLHGYLHHKFWQTSWSVRLWTAVSFIRDSSTCYNPFIYAWVNKNYRKEVNRLFRPLCTPYRLVCKRFAIFYRSISERSRGAGTTTTTPVTNSTHRGSQLRPIMFSETYNDMRLVNSVPNFGSRPPVMSNFYSVTLPVQSQCSVSNSRTMPHRGMSSRSR